MLQHPGNPIYSPETLIEEDNVGGSSSSIGGSLDGNTAVGALERWSVVDTVSGHSGQVTSLLQHDDDLVLWVTERGGETCQML